jgi:DNA-binding LacI/PurR family transcriptional regulator
MKKSPFSPQYNSAIDKTFWYNMTKMKKLPFTITRECEISLTNQLVDGVKKSIESGFFRPGDTLPSFKEIAKETGACMIVVREAFRRLSAQGYVVLRRRVGTIVLDTTQKSSWRGHIVIASLEVRENYLLSAMTGALRQALMEQRYLVSYVPFGCEISGSYDFAHLDSVLSGPISLVVSTDSSKEVVDHIAKSGKPFITFGSCLEAISSVNLDCSKAINDFVEHCKKAGVKKVIEVTVGSKLADAKDAFKKNGIKCVHWPVVKRGNIEAISKATLNTFYNRIKKHGKTWLPDVLYFNDNFACQSALLALLESGVDIPQDVKIVTWSNKGEGPFWRKTLSRIEIDPFEAGRIFARHVLAFLNKKRLSSNTVISPRYIPGETFLKN